MQAYEVEYESETGSRPMLLDESERTRCEVWTRVMGYHRPVSAFNPGKQSEHEERTFFQHRCRDD